MTLPKDPVMLLSVLNTLLRDRYASLEELAAAEGADAQELIQQMKAIDYTYNQKENRFV